MFILPCAHSRSSETASKSPGFFQESGEGPRQAPGRDVPGRSRRCVGSGSSGPTEPRPSVRPLSPAAISASLGETAPRTRTLVPPATVPRVKARWCPCQQEAGQRLARRQPRGRGCGPASRLARPLCAATGAPWGSPSCRPSFPLRSGSPAPGDLRLGGVCVGLFSPCLTTFNFLGKAHKLRLGPIHTET